MQLDSPVVSANLDETTTTKKHTEQRRKTPSNIILVVKAVDMFNRIASFDFCLPQ